MPSAFGPQRAAAFARVCSSRIGACAVRYLLAVLLALALWPAPAAAFTAEHQGLDRVVHRNGYDGYWPELTPLLQPGSQARFARLPAG